MMVARKRARRAFQDLKDSLLALPFAPKDDIPEVLVQIEDDLSLSVSRQAKVKDMFKYMRRVWIDGECMLWSGPLQPTG